MSYYNQGYDYTNTGTSSQGGGGYNTPAQGYGANQQGVAGQAYASSYPTAPSYGAQYGTTGGMENPAYGYNYNSWYGYGTPTAPTGAQRKKPTKPKVENVHCDVCNVNCAGQEAYTTHITGKKHAIQSRKKLAATAGTTNSDQRYSPYPTPTTATTTTGAAVIGPVPNPVKVHSKFYCELCDCSSTDHNTFNLHLAGKKHQSSIQKKQRAEVAAQRAAEKVAAAAAPSAPLQSPTTTTTNADGTPAVDGSTSATPEKDKDGRRGGHFSNYKKNRLSGPFRRHPRGSNGDGSGRSTTSRTPPVAVAMSPTDTNADNLLNAKHAELCPSSNTTLALSNLVASLTSRLSELGKKDDQTGITVNEVKLVGAYARGTLIKYNPTADIVVITKDPPNTAIVAAFQDILLKTAADTNVTFDPESTEILVQDNGFAVRVFVTWLGAWSASKKIVIMVHEEDKVVEAKQEVVTATTPEQLPAVVTTTTNTTTETVTTRTTQVAATEVSTGVSSMETDATAAPAALKGDEHTDGNTGGELTVPAVGAIIESPKVENLEGVNILMIWFNDNALCPNLRNVLRLLMDFRSRVAEFQSLTPWALEVIIVNALRGTPQTASISQSMRSLFAYIASGVLLPGVDLIDPCEQEPVHVLRQLSPNQRLEVTAVAQEIIREIAYGKWERVVGV